VVILVNKFSREKRRCLQEITKKKIRQELMPFTDVPILFVSALTKQRLLKALEATVKVYESDNVLLLLNLTNTC
jgi:GTP-binding protein